MKKMKTKKARNIIKFMKLAPLFLMEALGAVCIIWFVISFFDVIMNNSLSGNGPQLPWNMFVVFLNA